MSVSSTNMKPYITKASWDKQDKAFKPKISSRIIVRSVALIITQMVGPTPLPWPLPWRGGMVGKYLSIEIPNAVAISCVVDCNVFVIENAASSFNHIRCNASNAIHKTCDRNMLERRYC